MRVTACYPLERTCGCVFPALGEGVLRFLPPVSWGWLGFSCCVCVSGLVNGAWMRHGAESHVCLSLAMRCTLGQVNRALVQSSSVYPPGKWGDE